MFYYKINILDTSIILKLWITMILFQLFMTTNGEHREIIAPGMNNRSPNVPKADQVYNL